MLRLSVTMVDTLRYQFSREDSTTEDLRNELLRRTEPTDQMMAGRALHKAMELATDGQYSDLGADGYTFHMECDVDLSLPKTRELKATKVYEVDGEPVQIVGVVDTAFGNVIQDYKTTSRWGADKVERLWDTYQWRLYLDMFEGQRFRWDVFVTKPVAEREYIVTEWHPCEQWRYPSLAQDCQSAVEELTRFVRIHVPELNQTRKAA